MQVHLLGRALLRSGQLQLRVRRWCFGAAQSGLLCPDTSQRADMIRSRAQIKRVLCVAEKNDAAKGIAGIMSGGASRRVSHCPLTQQRQALIRQIMLSVSCADEFRHWQLSCYRLKHQIFAVISFSEVRICFGYLWI